MEDFLNKHSINHLNREEYIQSVGDKTTCHTDFRDCFYSGFAQDGAEELQKYLKSSEIVEDLKWHLEKLKKGVY